MALISCPECNHRVSDKAHACPQCGYPMLPQANEANRNASQSLTSMAVGVLSQDGLTSPASCHLHQADPTTTTCRSLPPGYKLYPTWAVTLATGFGSFMAGGILLAINYNRLGRGTAAVHSILWSAIATIAVIAAPIEHHGRHLVAFSIGQLLAMNYLAQWLQGTTINEHQRSGGSLASGWSAAGIGLLTGAVVLLILFVMLVMYGS